MNTNLNINPFKYIAAIVYDIISCFSLLIITVLILMLFTHGQALPSGHLPVQLILFSVIYLFFTQFWCRGKQTLGMRAWKIKIVNAQGNPISQQQACIRFFSALASCACLGFGFFWCLLNKNKRTWHDLIAGTYLINANVPESIK